MIAVLGFFAATLSICNIWPQVWRSCRHGRTLGFSPTAAWLGVGLNLCWLTFGVLTADPAQVLTNAVVGAGNTAVLVAVLATRPQLRSTRVLLPAAAGCAALVALAAGSAAAVAVLGVAPAVVATTLGAVITVMGVAAAVPQPLSLLRDPTQDLSGLSPARWWLGAGSCATWVVYAWLHGQPVLCLSAGFGLCCALVICGVLRAARRTARPVATVTALRPAPVRTDARVVLAA
ncbi:SemiSWEET transporter [Geodermatophilus sp. SYSU D00708]